ncbi:hypothetical protein MTR67_026682 [Solanum verrucosum]|uniref:Uncharacterized protein n=1 Tax=Solanum verrucosum TaxID=315347 RepID=A0AAF0QZE1_SOLVR|nr:hypothetical protein MTR67_026682 [Solanum verrucosum]
MGRHSEGPTVLAEVVMVAHLHCNNSLPHRGLVMVMEIQITYHDKATQTESEEEDTIEKILKAITTLCTKVDSMDNKIQKQKTNEDNLKSKTSQQHDYKNAELCRSEDRIKPELKGDDGKLLKTHKVCLNTAADISDSMAKQEAKIAYHDKATQTETEEENTIEKILKAITTLCTKVNSMDNEIQKLKTNEDNLKSKTSQQHDYKNAELCRSEDRKKPELKGDDGKLLKTHNVCLYTAAAPAEILYKEIKPPIQVIKIGLTKDMIIPEDIGQQEEICKIEIPSFYANKRIIGISTIIQELANNYLNGNAIWSYYARDQLMIYSNSRELRKADMDEVQIWILSLLKPEEQPTTRALKVGFVLAELLTRYCKLIGLEYPDHICSKCNKEDNIIPDV